MVQTSNLNDTQIVILATHFATESNFTQLQLLAAEYRSTLTNSLLYRLLLTYLPYDAESLPILASFIASLENDLKDVSNLDGVLDTSALQNASEKDTKQQLQNLRIDNETSLPDSTSDDELSAFIIQWLHRLEEASGIPVSVVKLLEPFVGKHPHLGLWQDSFLLPLLRLQNEYYPGRAEILDLETVERLSGVPGIKTLLQFAEQDGSKAQIGRDLNQVVSPWVRGASQAKRRRLSQADFATHKTSWRDVNEWIYRTSNTDFELAAKSFMEWNGPMNKLAESSTSNLLSETESLTQYVQTGLALIATSTGTGEGVNGLLRQLLDRVGSLSAALGSVITDPTKQALSNATKADLLHNSVLRPTNPLIQPTEEVFDLFDHCLVEQHLLESFKIQVPMIALIDVALFGSEERQKQELLRILQQVPRLTRSEIDWQEVRQHIHMLHSGSDLSTSGKKSASTYHFLGRISKNYLETEFLDVLIANGQYTTATDIYLDSQNAPLEEGVVQEHITSAIYAAYDNASNGNRNRGGLKRASDILRAFTTGKRASTTFMTIEHLIRATHSLSFYQLTLQHGVPFQPATIRVHHDPLSLIQKVLAQNHKAFTKLDDLVEIGQNLVRAGLPNGSDVLWESKSLEEQLFDAQHRVTYLAITSALSDGDFDTAYSYITTRLATSPSQTTESPFTDDTSWRAAYAAGKFRPPTVPKTLPDRITALSKRMDLLSLALTLTPNPDALSEILATWRRCEEEMDSLKAQAVEEERAIDTRSHSTGILPGGFAEDRDVDAAETRRMMERRALGTTGPSYEEEAPMGLFDVARGAASALRKSAFPLHSVRGQSNVRDHVEKEDDSRRESLDEQRTSGEYQRVRKRDMVSNMVTGGLVSGMSWVLGAQPPKSDEK